MAESFRYRVFNETDGFASVEINQGFDNEQTIDDSTQASIQSQFKQITSLARRVTGTATIINNLSYEPDAAILAAFAIGNATGEVVSHYINTTTSRIAETRYSIKAEIEVIDYDLPLGFEEIPTTDFYDPSVSQKAQNNLRKRDRLLSSKGKKIKQLGIGLDIAFSLANTAQGVYQEYRKINLTNRTARYNAERSSAVINKR